MARKLVLRMDKCVYRDPKYVICTLRADNDAYPSVTEFPGHRHQRVDEWSAFRKVLLSDRVS